MKNSTQLNGNDFAEGQKIKYNSFSSHSKL